MQDWPWLQMANRAEHDGSMFAGMERSISSDIIRRPEGHSVRATASMPLITVAGRPVRLARMSVRGVYQPVMAEQGETVSALVLDGFDVAARGNPHALGT